MTTERRTLWTLFLVSSIGLLMMLNGCGDDGKPQKNRVPTVTQQLEQAQQAAQDAKSSAEQAQKALDKVNEATKKLNGEQRDSDGNLKEGRPETTHPGIATSFGSFKVEKYGQDSSSDDYYLGFTFTDGNGYTKKFFPVCPNQSIPTNRVSLMYHWLSWRSNGSGERGCFKIDGYQQ